MKDKIEEILEAYTNYGFGENLDNVIEMEFKMKTPTGKVGEYIGYPSLVNELTTLIQEERKEAVRGLIEYLEVNTDKVFYLGCGKMINEYLGTVESEGIERENKMKFKKNTIKKPITAKDYKGKPCLLSSYERLKKWKVNNPNHWYTLGLERPKDVR